MDPQLGRHAFRIGAFITLTAAFLLLVVRPGTAEYYVSAFSLIIGLVFMGVVLAAVRFFVR